MRREVPREVLLVEDDRDIVSLMEIHLRDLDCHVTTAHDGRDGLDLALRRKWDLVILDLGLPRVDGTDICRQLREIDSRVGEGTTFTFYPPLPQS